MGYTDYEAYFQGVLVLKIFFLSSRPVSCRAQFHKNFNQEIKGFIKFTGIGQFRF